MKRSYKFLTVFLVVGSVLAGGLLATNAMASQTAEKQATQAVTTYLAAMKSGDVEKAAKVVKDIRVKDETQKKEKLRKYISQKTDYVETRFVSVTKANDSNFNANLQLVTSDGKILDLVLPVVKEDGQWVLVVGNSDVQR